MSKVDYKNEFYKQRLDDYKYDRAAYFDKKYSAQLESIFKNRISTIKNVIGYICLLCVTVGFIFVLFGNPFDSESFFRTLISADYAPFSLDDFITGAHNILPDDVGIFNGIENLFIAIGCLGYSIGFLINLVFALLFA